MLRPRLARLPHARSAGPAVSVPVTVGTRGRTGVLGTHDHSFFSGPRAHHSGPDWMMDGAPAEPLPRTHPHAKHLLPVSTRLRSPQLRPSWFQATLSPLVSKIVGEHLGSTCWDPWRERLEIGC